MFPRCSQCGSATRPATDEERQIYGGVAALPGLMTWKCTKCSSSFVRPLEPQQVEPLKEYVRKQQKRWWQFWV